MKGLATLPGIEELQIGYRELEEAAYSKTPLEEERIAILSQWARLDPRLAEIFTNYLSECGAEIQIFRLLRALAAQPWPRAILVPLRFAEFKIRLAGRGGVRLALLRDFALAVEREFPTRSNDLFFIPLQRPSRVVMDEMIALQSEPYSRAGYVGSTSLLSKGRIPEGVTLMTHDARKRMLQRLLAEHGGDITVENYLESCRGGVSRRQAQRDLEAEPRLRPIGFTRNRRYRIRGY